MPCAPQMKIVFDLHWKKNGDNGRSTIHIRMSRYFSIRFNAFTYMFSKYERNSWRIASVEFSKQLKAERKLKRATTTFSSQTVIITKDLHVWKCHQLSMLPRFDSPIMGITKTRREWKRKKIRYWQKSTLAIYVIRIYIYTATYDSVPLLLAPSQLFEA